MPKPQILFATDLSETDRHPFRLACRLAEAWRARLLIVHVNDPGVEWGMSPRLDPHQRLHDLMPNDLEVDYEHLLKEGDPADVIAEFEQQENVDLIVLGTHGRKGLQRAFQGSVAEKVIRSAHCPVLTLRQSHGKRPWGGGKANPHILVPTDFSVHSHAALDFASKLAHAIDAKITIVYVDESARSSASESAPSRSPTGEREQMIWRRLKNYVPTEQGVEYGHKILFGDPEKAISQYACTEPFDFVIMGTHGRTGIKRVLMGSVAEQVVRNTDCPIITVKLSNKMNPALR